MSIIHCGPEIDEHGIYHIDGPPRAYFEVADSPSAQHSDNVDYSKPVVVRLVYRIVCYYGETSSAVKRDFDAALNVVKSELQDLKIVTGVDPIIWWRRRPECSEFTEGRRTFTKWYCRFATTPPIPELVWSQIETLEGELPRETRA